MLRQPARKDVALFTSSWLPTSRIAIGLRRAAHRLRATVPAGIRNGVRQGWPGVLRRRERVLLGLSLAAFLGVAALFAGGAWFFWNESVRAEERELAALAETVGTQTNATIVEARDMLERLNGLDVPRCSDEHLAAMEAQAVDAPHIRSIGYWHAADRQCGVGFLQAVKLRPPAADRIYDSGVIAWWPGPDTEASGIELFLMRFGSHDVAMDPRRLLDVGPVHGHRIGLWVEGLRMTERPVGAELPNPEALPAGLTIDRENQRVVARFTLDTVFPIDIVAVEPMGAFWGRYGTTLALAGAAALLLAGGWVYGVVRYSRHRLSLGTELRESIDHNRLAVRYQPIVELDSGRCVGAEALVRWRRESGETVSPDTFLPLAEEAGLIPRITLAVLDTSLRELGPLLRSESSVRININLAPEDLENEQFSEALMQRIAASGVSPDRIRLEITERALINTDSARNVIAALRRRGHQIAIDDFGTGYSSLSYLESFEIDTLKIDRSFVEAIDRQAVTSYVIGHVISMAKSLNLAMVAEGVSSDTHVDWLTAQGVKLGQGFLFSEAISARRFRTYVERSRTAATAPDRRRGAAVQRLVSK